MKFTNLNRQNLPENNLSEINVDNVTNKDEIPNFQCRKSSVLQRQPENNENKWNDDNEYEEEENSMLLMKRTIEKMDKLQEELDNVRKDFFKLSSLNSTGLNQNVGVKVNSDDCKDGEEENALQFSGILRHTESRKVMQFNNDRKLLIDRFDLNHDHCDDSNCSRHSGSSTYG